MVATSPNGSQQGAAAPRGVPIPGFPGPPPGRPTPAQLGVPATLLGLGGPGVTSVRPPPIGQPPWRRNSLPAGLGAQAGGYNPPPAGPYPPYGSNHHRGMADSSFPPPPPLPPPSLPQFPPSPFPPELMASMMNMMQQYQQTTLPGAIPKAPGAVGAQAAGALTRGGGTRRVEEADGASESRSRGAEAGGEGSRAREGSPARAVPEKTPVKARTLPSRSRSTDRKKPRVESPVRAATAPKTGDDPTARPKSPESDGQLSEGENWIDGGTDLESPWVADSRYYDNRSIYGLRVPKKIPPTQWSQSAKSAGMSPYDAKVFQYLYNGDKSYDFRSVANGRFVLFKVCRNVGEFHAAGALLSVLRSRDDKVDLDAIIKAHVEGKGETLKSDKIERKAQRKQAIIEQVTQLMAPWRKPKGDPDEVTKLKAELARVMVDLAAAKAPASLAAASSAASLPGQSLPPRISERLMSYQRVQESERVFTKACNKVTAVTKTEVTRLTSALCLSREEKVSVAGALAEITDMCTVGNQVSSLEAESMSKEVKRLLTDWGIPNSYLTSRLTRPTLLSAIELLALATVIAARALSK